MSVLTFFQLTLAASWNILLDSAPYVLFGIAVSGGLKIFLSTEYIAAHLGRDRYLSVIKAALFGIPLPLCSCGVLPAAAALQKHGANNGATTAFLISTPESGVDSIAISYALLDPIMTGARPLAAFLSAMLAGCLENYVHPPRFNPPPIPMFTPPFAQNVHAGKKCDSDNKQRTPSLFFQMRSGVRYALFELWGDLASWFALGILLAGIITVVVPDELMASYFGGGLSSMLLMLFAGIPIYICATASTPIAAALILKGVSPGAALVFLLVGPATNIASLSVLTGLLGKRATLRYLFSISVGSVLCGLAVEKVYQFTGVVPRAVIGQAAEILPFWLQAGSALILVIISFRPITQALAKASKKIVARFS